MVYPSHYSPGWNGFDVPGNHPEIIGIGTRGALEKLKAGHLSGTLIRPWLQASSYKTPNYGPQYIRHEIKSAEKSGAVGWLMWDPGNSYWAVWAALPLVPAGGSPRQTRSLRGRRSSLAPRMAGDNAEKRGPVAADHRGADAGDLKQGALVGRCLRGHSEERAIV
jgi:hypothetical protein